MGLRLGAAAREVIGAEIFIQRAVLEHVVSGGEDRGGDGADRLLGAAPSAQPHELRPQVGCLGAGGCPRALDQHIFEPERSLAQAGRPPLVGTFVIARAQPGPRPQVPGRGEPLMSVPISDRMTWALSSLTPGIVLSCLTASRKQASAASASRSMSAMPASRASICCRCSRSKKRCCPLTRPRKAPRSVAAEARTLVRASAASWAGSVRPLSDA